MQTFKTIYFNYSTIFKIHLPLFFRPLQLFEYLKEFDKFGIVVKQEPGGILQQNLLWKKTKSKKNEDNNFQLFM